MRAFSKSWTGVLAIVALSLLCLGADRPADEQSNAALEKLQGAWVWQQATFAGESIPPEDARQMSFTFKGDQVIPSNNVNDPATIRLDASKTPAMIDFIDKEERVDQGIFKIEGDLLTFCMATADSKKPRPTDFTSTAANEAILVVMKKND